MQVVQPWIQQQTVLHGDHVVAGRAAEAQPAFGCQRELNVVAIAVCQEGGRGRVIVRGRIGQRDDVGDGRIRDAAEAAQLIGDDLLLEFGLARVGDVLPLAAAAGIRRRAEVGAGRLDAIRAGFQHVQEPGARPTIPLLDDLDSHALTRDGVRHEDGLPRVPADGLTPVGDGVEVDFDGLRHVYTLLRAA